MKNKRAFTLIEMLVVVAVIGILSSVLLTALGPARDKAKDARIIQEVNQVRSYAETLYGTNYSALIEIDQPFGVGEDNPEIGDTTLSELFYDMQNNGGRLIIWKSADSNRYKAFSPLNTTVPAADNPEIQLTQYYCVDSAGKSAYVFEDMEVNSLFNQNETTCP